MNANPSYEQLLAICIAQQEQIAQLQDEIKLLKELLNRNSKNSSSPPSQNRRSKPKKNTNKVRKKRSRGFGLSRVPLEKVTAFFDHKPDCCTRCQGQNFTTGFVKSSRQTIDVPPIQPIVHEHRRWACRCKTCGLESLGKYPDDVTSYTYGSNLRSWLAILRVSANVTMRKALGVLSRLLGIRLSLGCIVNVEQQFSNATEPVYAQLLKEVRTASVVHADETGWFNQSKRHWIWVACTEGTTAFQIARSRGAKAALSLLGLKEDRVLVTDRWGPYEKVPGERQYCLAHLIRNLKAVEERSGVDELLGGVLRVQLQYVCSLWRSVAEGSLSREKAAELSLESKTDHQQLLEMGIRKTQNPKTQRFFKELLTAIERMFCFINKDGVPTTNNAAERALRPLVLKRKVSLGSWSDKGDRFIERAFSIFETCRLRALDFVGVVRRAFILGMQKQTLSSLAPT